MTENFTKDDMIVMIVGKSGIGLRQLRKIESRIPAAYGLTVDDLHSGLHTAQYLTGMISDARSGSDIEAEEKEMVGVDSRAGIVMSLASDWILTKPGLQRLAELESKPGAEEFIKIVEGLKD